MRHIATLLIFLGALPLTSCKNSNGVSTEAGPTESLAISVSPSSPQFGQTITLSAVSQRPYASYLWTVTTPSNQTLSGTTSTQQVLLQEIGTYQAQVQGVDGDNNTVTATQSITSTITTNANTPTLHLIAVLSQAGVPIATIASGSSAQGNPIVDVGPVSLDFSQSYSSDSTQPFSSFTFQVDWGSGPETVSNPATNTFDSSHAYPVSLRMTDAQGDTVVQVFTLYVKCPPSSAQNPPLQVSLDAASAVTTGALDNEFFYTPNTISGGLPPYFVRWDFDGDSVLDTGWMPANQQEAWSYWVGPRQVTLWAMDSCFNTATSTATVNLPIADTSYVVTPSTDLSTYNWKYLYLDAQVTSSDPTSQKHNGHFLATSPRSQGLYSQWLGGWYTRTGSGTDPHHIRVNTGGSFYLQGMDGTNNAGVPYAFAGLTPNSSHGIALSVNGIADSVGGTVTPTVSMAGARIYRGTFSDDRLGYTPNAVAAFSMPYQNCTISNAQIVIDGSLPDYTCDVLPADQNITYNVRISGNWQCLDATSTAYMDTLNFTEGGFFAEFDQISACGPLPPNCKPGVVCYVSPH